MILSIRTFVFIIRRAFYWSHCQCEVQNTGISPYAGSARPLQHQCSVAVFSFFGVAEKHALLGWETVTNSHNHLWKQRGTYFFNRTLARILLFKVNLIKFDKWFQHSKPKCCMFKVCNFRCVILKMPGNNLI